MEVSIGNRTWEMGIPFDGEFARTGNSRIKVQNVRHIMNNQKCKKFILAFKELLKYYETGKVEFS